MPEVPAQVPAAADSDTHAACRDSYADSDPSGGDPISYANYDTDANTDIYTCATCGYACAWSYTYVSSDTISYAYAYVCASNAEPTSTDSDPEDTTVNLDVNDD